MKVLVSACLLGHNCRYNGKNNLNPKICQLLKGHEVLAVCPEVLGGLPTPRIPCEINEQGRVINQVGEDVTQAFESGADQAIQMTEDFQPDLAILQKRSPSCGSSQIYDGTFTGKLISGEGFFAGKLKGMNIPILEAESEK